MQKKTVSSVVLMPATRSKYHSSVKVTTKNRPPVRAMPRIMLRLTMKASLGRGFSCITSRLGGSEASAMAAKVSMMRFIHSICVMVSGSSVPRNEPHSTSNSAVTLTTSWKKMKRWMFL